MLRVTALSLAAAFACIPAVASAADTAPASAGPFAGAASEDRDRPGTSANEPPFYAPTPQEQLLAPPPPGAPFMLSILEDGHGFVSGGGFGAETRLRFGKPAVGLTVGMFGLDAAEIGLDLLRYMGVRVATKSESLPFDVYVLLPDIDLRAYFDGGSRAGVVAGTSLSGVRIANCSLTGCAEISLRVLTADVWYDFGSQSQSLSLGGGLSAGIKLW